MLKMRNQQYTICNVVHHCSEGKKNLFNRRNFQKFLCVSSMSLITTIFSFRGGDMLFNRSPMAIGSSRLSLSYPYIIKKPLCL